MWANMIIGFVLIIVIIVMMAFPQCLKQNKQKINCISDSNLFIGKLQTVPEKKRI